MPPLLQRCPKDFLPKTQVARAAAGAWRYDPAVADRPGRITSEVARTRSTSAVFLARSRDLKKRGWRFVGPAHAHLEVYHARA